MDREQLLPILLLMPVRALANRENFVRVPSHRANPVPPAQGANSRLCAVGGVSGDRGLRPAMGL
jgi:hypothetical protein